MRPIFNPDGWVLYTSTRLVSEREVAKQLKGFRDTDVSQEDIKKFLEGQREDILERFRREASRLSDRATSIEGRDITCAITQARDENDDIILSLWYRFTYVLDREGYTADVIIDTNLGA